MTIPTNTFDTYAAVGNREDLTDIIYNIAPTDTPFMSGIKKGKAAKQKSAEKSAARKAAHKKSK